jgi:hypothetical protein
MPSKQEWLYTPRASTCASRKSPPSVRSLVRWFVCSLVRLFVCSFVRWLERWHLLGARLKGDNFVVRLKGVNFVVRPKCDYVL